MPDSPNTHERVHEVNAHHLVWMMWTRRSLRFLRDLFLLGLVLWIVGELLALTVVFDPYSTWWKSFRDVALPGIALFGLLLGACMVAMAALRSTGPARQLASDLVPATGRGRLPEVTDGEGRAGSLLRILRRKRFVGFPVTLLFCCVLVVVGVCGVVLTYLVHTTFGIGAHEVVLGENASLVSSDEAAGGGILDLSTLDTPYGEVVARGVPEPGDHYFVFEDEGFDNIQAYPAREWFFLVPGVLVLGGLIVLILLGRRAATHIREELRRRILQDRSPLGDSLAELQRGKSVTLRTVPLQKRGQESPESAGSDDATAEPAVPGDDTANPSAARSAVHYRISTPRAGFHDGSARLRKGRLVMAGAWVFVIVLGLAGAALFTVDMLRVEVRSTDLDYMSPSSWESHVTVLYENHERDRTMLSDVVGAGLDDGSLIDDVWKVSLYTDYDLDWSFSAYLTVGTFKATPVNNDTWGLLTYLRDEAHHPGDPKPAKLDGLAAGWKGFRVQTNMRDVVYAVKQTDDAVLILRVDPLHLDEQRQLKDPPEITEEVLDFTEIINKRGVSRLVDDTARPEYF